MQLLAPRASLLCHLAGVLAGLLHVGVMGARWPRPVRGVFGGRARLAASRCAHACPCLQEPQLQVRSLPPWTLRRGCKRRSAAGGEARGARREGAGHVARDAARGEQSAGGAGDGWGAGERRALLATAAAAAEARRVRAGKATTSAPYSLLEEGKRLLILLYAMSAHVQGFRAFKPLGCGALRAALLVGLQSLASGRGPWCRDGRGERGGG